MLQQPQTQDQLGISGRYDLARILTIVSLLILSSMLIVVPVVFGIRVEFLAMFLALQQDLPVVLVFMLAALARLSPKTATGDFLDHGRPILFLSLLLILIAGWAGHYIVFQGSDLSRDENMAVFDQDIFSHGKLMWPIPLEWRSVADALNRRFMLPIGANEYWVSGYLPIHSATRALIDVVADPALTSPIFTAIGALSLWGIARKLWPDSPRIAALAMVLLITSSQVLLTSMTAFAMSMHLGLNLLWLLLFLKDRPQFHLLASLVGFFATGIHQPLFHPLFALPFLTLLVFRRRWKLSAFYLAAYALIAAVWMWWPMWIVSHGVGPTIPIVCTDANCSSGASFVDRLAATVTTVGVSNLWLTSANLLRLIVWQHPLLLPLAIFGAVTCWRSEPLVKALVASFLLPIVVMAVILPWQGHGWGYRYVHPVLGCAILLACYGFARLERNELSLRRPLMLTIAVAVLLLGLHAVMASRMAKPYADLRKELASLDADVVIVDSDAVPFGQDVVVNDFDLANRPKLMIATLVKPGDLPELCKHSTLGFFDGPRMAPLLTMYTGKPPPKTSPKMERLHAAAAASGCRVTVHAR